MRYRSFENVRKTGTSKQEFERMSDQGEDPFDERVKRLSAFIRWRIKEDHAFVEYVSVLSAHYGEELPTEANCEEIAESSEGKRFFNEEPKVLAAILEYRKFTRV